MIGVVLARFVLGFESYRNLALRSIPLRHAESNTADSSVKSARGTGHGQFREQKHCDQPLPAEKEEAFVSGTRKRSEAM